MGAGVSAGESNDELIDNLIEADFIKTSLVERVFRAVDRGNYILSDPHVNPYRDVAWKNHNFHISAPCIYSEVMEGLKLEPGLSFLNLGSGTGYLNTMVGLILGYQGINHGIELHEDVIQYANKKLEDFKLFSGAMDEFDLCEPKFIQGNCLCLANGTNLYDRVYCGAACTDEYLFFIRNLIKIGGILIVPYNERLVEIVRTSETNWNTKSLLPVSFASLVPPVHGCETDEVHLPKIETLSLQELCRATIRNILRKIIESEHPSIVNRTVLHKPMKKKKLLKRDGNSRNRNGANSLVISRSLRDREEPFDYLLLSVTKRSQISINSLENELETSESDSGSVNDHDAQLKTTEQTKVTVEREVTTSDDEGDKIDSEEEKLKLMHGVFVDILSSFGSNNTEPSTSTPKDEDERNQSTENGESKSKTEMRNKRKKLLDDCSSDTGNETNTEEENNPKPSSNSKYTGGRDSGKKEASSSPDVEIETESSDNEDPDDDIDDDEDDDDDNNDTSEGDVKKNRCRCKSGKYANSKFRKVDPNGTGDEITCDRTTNGMKVYKSPYTEHMKLKIKELPLPMILKKYLNFHREL